MADYPATFYNPREKENWPGLVFDADKKTLIYNEDFVSLEEEIQAIEAALGLNFRDNIDIDESGEVSLPNQSMVEAYRAVSTQYIPSSSPVIVSFNGKSLDVQSEFDATVKAGTATSTVVSHLIDNVNNQFVASDVGKTVYNKTDKTYTVITAFNSVSDVTLDTNIMASGETYDIFFSRFTPKVTGRYLVKCQVTLSSTVGNKIYNLLFYVNDVLVTYYTAYFPLTNQVLLHSTAILSLNANDYFDVRFSHNAASNAPIYYGFPYSHLSIQKLT